MNKEKILKLADFIEQSDSFSMHRLFWIREDASSYGTGIKNTESGCPACILGHLRVMEGSYPDDQQITVCSNLGVSACEHHAICEPDSEEENVSYRACPDEKDYITQSMAVVMLRNFVDTRKVEWRVQN